MDTNFQDLIKLILRTRGGVNNKELLEKMTTGQYLERYKQAFTSPTFDADVNYENLEFLGDSIVNTCIIRHLYKRFPILRHPLGFKVLARLKILYISKEVFHKIAEYNLGFGPFIRIDQDILNGKLRHKIFTDTLEAFIAVTEMILDEIFEVGCGFGIVQNIINNLFSELPISLKYEDLYDSITRLKEIFEYQPFKGKIGIYRYEHTSPKSPDVNNIHTTTVVWTFPNGMVKRIQGTGQSQTAAQKRAADLALREVIKNGFVKPLPPAWVQMNLG